jgi:hypothetical protein
MWAAWQAIGHEIVSGQQRDIDFRRFDLTKGPPPY